jgi:hypothetical protein
MVAFGLLGVGVTAGYGLIKTGQLQRYKIGRATRITVKSIHDFVARQIAAEEQAKRSGAIAEPEKVA